MVILSKFAERLHECLGEENPARLAKQLNVARSTMFEWLRGSFLPSTRSLVLLAERFACSTDYLLGLTELPAEYELQPILPFGQRLREVLGLFSVSQYRLEKEAEISGSVVYGWLTGRAEPTVESLVRLAEYLGCSVDFLLGRER